MVIRLQISWPIGVARHREDSWMRAGMHIVRIHDGKHYEIYYKWIMMRQWHYKKIINCFPIQKGRRPDMVVNDRQGFRHRVESDNHRGGDRDHQTSGMIFPMHALGTLSRTPARCYENIGYDSHHRKINRASVKACVRRVFFIKLEGWRMRVIRRSSCKCEVYRLQLTANTCIKRARECRMQSTTVPSMDGRRVQEDGRWTRSKGKVEEQTGKGLSEVAKGKAVEAEFLPRVYLDIRDESEEECDIHEYLVDEDQRRGTGGKIGKRLRRSEDLEEPKYFEEGRGGRRGRGQPPKVRGTQRGLGTSSDEGGRGRRQPQRRVRGRARRDMNRELNEAEEAYNHGTSQHMRKVIDQLEEEAMQAASDPEMEEWQNFIPDPGHTRGRLSLYKQSLHAYWGMKRLLARAMEQIAVEMIELVHGLPTFKRELRNIQMTLNVQNYKLDKILQLLKENGFEIKAEGEPQMDIPTH